MKKNIISSICIITIGALLIINAPKVIENNFIEKRSIFISYIELSEYLSNRSVDESKKNIDLMIKNIKEMGFNEIILQVRSFCDAIYDSKIYPYSMMVSSSEGVSPGYDILEYFLNRAHKNGITLIAWINPYRVRNSSDISSISDKSPVYQYLNSDILYVRDGIYLNPSKEETRKLIVEGVEEIVKNYDVDGILFDDYFYPNNEIDRDDYNKYLQDNEYISKEQYNLNVVSKMIKEVHDVCSHNNVLFGVSPDGNMENNYEKVYADVKKWCSSDEYIDFIMPQVYYGFYNETKPFKEVVDEWESIITDEDVKLYVALAFYKVGEVDKYAKSGKEEWLNNSDIIMREIIASRNLNKYQGFSLFRYDYVFNDSMHNEISVAEIENMKKVLN